MLLAPFVVLLAAADPVVARIDAREVRASELGPDAGRAEKLVERVRWSAWQRLLADPRTEPAQAELDSFVRWWRRQRTVDPVTARRHKAELERDAQRTTAPSRQLRQQLLLADIELARASDPPPAFVRETVRTYRAQKLLHQRYGGRIIFQQAGPEPVGAFAPWLEDEERAGRFEIFDSALRDAFHACVHRELSGSDLPGDALDVPWWEQPPTP